MAKIKKLPEDFKVFEEVSPDFLTGGNYRIYRMWKRGMGTEDAVRRVAAVSGVPLKFVSYGGLKDKNAVTVQFVSVPRRYRLKEIKERNLKVSFRGFSTRPVSPAVVVGNRFEILVRERSCREDRISVLKKWGVPGYYGEQRFVSLRGGEFFVSHLVSGDFKSAVFYLFTPVGWESSRARRAKKLFVSGDFDGASTLFSGWRRKVCRLIASTGDFRKAFSAIPEKEIEFQFNVFQSYLFNRYLEKLIRESTSSYAVFKYRAGTMVFPLESVALPDEIPIFCPGDESEIYLPVLEELGIDMESLERFSRFFHRFSRKSVVSVREFSVRRVDEGFIVRLFLPSGHYATNVIRFLFDAVREK
ncbi:tRNA pseudouridine(13) synthase TruD [Desulfurobacterium sp.]